MARKEEIEKKADEISGKYGNSKVLPTEEECVAYNTAIEMAKWADKTMIEKAISKCALMLLNIDELLRKKGLKGQFEEEFDNEYKKFKKALEEQL